MEWGRLALVVLGLTVGLVRGDTPANCTFEDIAGTWTFYESERSGDSTLQCTGKVAVVDKMTVDLMYPNSAVDQVGNFGTWTMIYNQGFEVTINGRSFFGFSDYEVLPNKGGVVSHCDRTKAGEGWSHDVTVRNWACFTAKKKTRGDEEFTLKKFHSSLPEGAGNKAGVYKQESWMVNLINEFQTSWVATSYPNLEGMTHDDIERMKGGPKSRMLHKPSPKPKLLLSSTRGGARRDSLPQSWDWRDVDGVNYVSEVRDQGGCGSCYAFSAMGMLEARVNILTKNTKRYTFSPQDVVSCSPLSQGCQGGFPYLIAGRYGKDFGVVEEGCNPYKGNDTASCGTSKCLRHYSSSYQYVGGYYGACNEYEMKKSLVENGPLSVSFQVYDDFMMYKSGVYHHTKLLMSSGFEPFQLTNHAVLLVGYGHDQEVGEDYWIVKNSWGTGWGENGFFRMRRGVDECAIESIAVEAFPIP